MSFGKLLLGVAVLGGAAWAINRSNTAATGNSKTPPASAYNVIDAYFGGAKPGDTGIPIIVVLHGEGSTPTAAFKTLEGKDMYANGWPSPVRILCPMGRYGDQVARYYVDPTLKTKGEYQSAQRQEADKVAEWLAGVAEFDAYKPVPPKFIVVGLGANGAMPVLIALHRPELVRQAYGTGGAVPSYWVAGAVPLDGKPSPLIRKLSYGDGIGPDDAAQKAAKELGYDFETMDLPEPPSEATVQKWLLPQIDDQLKLP